MVSDKLIKEIKYEEGFKGNVYQCTEGYDTIGFGTKLPLSESEAEMILRSRLTTIAHRVSIEYSHLQVSNEAWDILNNMAYQLGVNGLGKFKKMFNALYDKDYFVAAMEMRDSKWYNQTPNRAERLAQRMEGIK